MEPRSSDAVCATELLALVDATRGAAEESAGLTSLERLVRSAGRAGAARVIVLAPGDPTTLRLPPPARTDGSGSSPEAVLVTPGSVRDALASGAVGRGRLLFAHTEIGFDPDYLARLAAVAGDGDVVAGVAPLLPHEPRPGLGAVVRNGQVVSLDAVSPVRLTGAVVLPAALALELCPAEGEEGCLGALERLLSRLAAEGRLRAFCPSRGYVSVLDGTQAARTRLRRGLVGAAGKASDGLVSRHHNRRLSGALTRLLLDTPVTPNALTLATLALGVAAALLAALGTHASFVAGAFLYQANSALDGCDGEIARIRFESSRVGEWLDTISDQVGNVSFAVAVPYGLWRRSGNSRDLLIGAFVGVGMLVSLAVVAARTRRAALPGASAGNFNDYGRSLARGLGETSIIAGRALGALALLFRRDAYALLFFVLALVGADRSVLYLLAGGVLLHLLSFVLRPSREPLRGDLPTPDPGAS